MRAQEPLSLIMIDIDYLLTACNDGLDNDGDSLIDYPADPCCRTSLADIDEYNAPLAQCADGIDNDGDLLVDLADLGCSSATDNDETDVATSVHVGSLTGPGIRGRQAGRRCNGRDCG